MAEWRKEGRLLFLLWLLMLPEPAYLQSATTPQQGATTVAPLDLFICLDSSSSIGEENYDNLKAAVVRFLEQLPISEQGIHVGVRPFSWALSEQYVALSSNASALYEGVAGLPYMRGRTRTDLAIEDAVRELTTNGRPEAAKAIAVLTDGMPTFPTDAMAMAKKAQNLDIEMFAVGFGSLISQAGLLILAPESNVFSEDSFDQVPEGLLSFAKTQLELQGTTTSVNLTTSFEVSSAASRTTAGSSATSSMFTGTTRNPSSVSTGESGAGPTSTGFSSVGTEITITTSRTAASAFTSKTTTTATESLSSTLRSSEMGSSTTTTSPTTTTTAAAETGTETSLATLRPSVPTSSTATTPTTTTSTSRGLTATSASGTTAFYSGNATASVSSSTHGTALTSEPTTSTTPSTGAAIPTTGSTSALTSGRALSTMTSSRASEPASGTSIAKTTLGEISSTTVSDRAASSSYSTLSSAEPSRRPSSTSGASALETETTLPLSTTASIENVTSTTSTTLPLLTTASTENVTSSTSHDPFTPPRNTSTASETYSSNFSSAPTPTTTKSLEVTAGPGSTKFGETSSTVRDVSSVSQSSTTQSKSTTTTEQNGFTSAALSQGTATSTVSLRSSTTTQREGTLSTVDSTTSHPDGTTSSQDTENTTTTMATTALPGSSSTLEGTATTGRPTPVSQDCEGGDTENPLSVGKATKGDTSAGSKKQTGGICESPDITVQRGVGFLSHPFNCGRFVQCYPAAGGSLTAVTRVCGAGLFWNQELLRCDPATVVTCPSDLCLNEDVSHYKMEGNCRAFWRCQNGRSFPSCCGRGKAYFPGQGCIPCPGCKDNCPFSCSSKPVCGSKPDWLALDGYYLSVGALGWLPATCFMGFFDVSQCACSLDSLTDLGCKLYLYLSFDEKEYDSAPTIERVNVLQVNGIGMFLGDARLSFVMSFADIVSRKADRPLHVNFRYIELSPMEAGDRQVLVQSSPCALGGLLVLYLDNTAIFVRIFNQQGEVASTEIFTEGFDILAWKIVRMRYSSSGGFVIKVLSKKLTYTSFIKVPPNLSVSDCGWTFGSPQGLDHLSPFTGGMDEIKISYC